MPRMKVFFSPTPSNQIMVERLRKLDRVNEFCSFKPLPADPDERIRQLMRIDGRAAYIWGDGESHHESYHFTRARIIKLKINLDYHEDDKAGSTFPEYATHMASTKKDKKKIIVPVFLGDWTTRITDMIAIAKKEGLEFSEKEIAVTMDCDFLVGFPVMGKWIPVETFTLEPAIDLIRSLGPRIFRFDIGGLVEKIPEFEVVPVDLNKPVSKEVLRSFSNRFGVKKPQSVDEAMAIMCSCKTQISKEEIDYIGSYALQVYANVLEVVARSIKS